MTRQQARTIACGLLHDGIQADKLSPKARGEIRAALDVILKLAGKTKSAEPSVTLTGNDSKGGAT